MYSINDLNNNSNNEEEGQFQRISSSRMMTMMMSDREQRSFGMPLDNVHVEAPGTSSTRRGERRIMRERKTCSFQILSPVGLLHKPVVKRKETRRSCLRPTSSLSGLRAYGCSVDFPSDYYPPMVSSNYYSTTTTKKQKVVRFWDDVVDEGPTKIRWRNTKHRTNF